MNGFVNNPLFRKAPATKEDSRLEFLAYSMIFACANMAALYAAKLLIFDMDIRAAPALVIMALVSLYCAKKLYRNV